MIYSLLLYTCLVSSGGHCRVHQVNLERMNLGACLKASQTEAAKYWEENLHTRFVVGSKCTDRPQRYLHANEA